ncbi:MAG TPA: mechanosensitive ion channel domain-containing protein [Geminicoccaceae bacterium]
MRNLIVAALACLYIATAATAAAAERVEAAPDAPTFPVDQINEGLPALDPEPHLATPQATLEHFIRAVRGHHFLDAAHALDLRFVDIGPGGVGAADLARKLGYLLNSSELPDWSSVPDTPDARVHASEPNESTTFARRTIHLGDLPLDGHKIPVNLQRFRLPDDTAVWLFSPFTVEHIDALYAANGPGVLERLLPADVRLQVLDGVALWEWAVLALLLVFAWALARLVTKVLRVLVDHMSWPRPRFVVREIARPFALAFGVGVFYASSTYLLPLAGPLTAVVDTLALMVLLATGTWLVLRLVSALLRDLRDAYVTPLDLERHDARQLKTQARVAERVIVVLAFVILVALALSYLEVFDNLGLSLLASAGALTVLLSFAAQPLLGNLVAGIQIAATKPVQIGDVVEYEGHWARVEDITFTYTVFRTWTEKRLIVPHLYLLDRPLQNWSKHDETITRVIALYCDHRIDVDALRKRYKEVLEGDERWTGQNLLVEVNDIREDAVEVWCWVSGKDSSSSWALHNDVREQLLRWLQTEAGGRYLPRQRMIFPEGLPTEIEHEAPEARPETSEHDDAKGHPEAA